MHIDTSPWEGAGKGGKTNKQTSKTLHPGSHPHQRGDQLRQRRNFGVLEENTAIRLK